MKKQKYKQKQEENGSFGWIRKKPRMTLLATLVAIAIAKPVLKISYNSVKYAYEHGIPAIINYITQDKYHFLEQYNLVIEETVAKHNLNLDSSKRIDPTLVKAMVAYQIKYAKKDEANNLNDLMGVASRNKNLDLENRLTHQESISAGIDLLYSYADDSKSISNNTQEVNKTFNEQKLSTYFVKKGDVLSRISKNLNVSIADLKSQNPNLNPNKIFPGQKIIYTTNPIEKILTQKTPLKNNRMDWNKALLAYGNGDTNYTKKVINEIYLDLKTREISSEARENAVYSLDDNFKSDSEENVLARLLYGEVRGQLNVPDYVYGVINSLVNRAKAKNKSVKEIALQNNGKTWQYTCFNPDDTNRRKVENPLNHSNLKIWDKCYALADITLNQGISLEPDNPQLKNATNYWVDFVNPPIWAYNDNNKRKGFKQPLAVIPVIDGNKAYFYSFEKF